MRYLGIDYGNKRMGLSYADEVEIAVPLLAVTGGTLEDKVLKIVGVIQERRIEGIVVGYPYNMDDTVGFKAKEVEAFVDLLKQHSPLPIWYTDERLTTYCAQTEITGSIAKKKKRLTDIKRQRNSGIIDSRAATLILQDFIDQIRQKTHQRIL